MDIAFVIICRLKTSGPASFFHTTAGKPKPPAVAGEALYLLLPDVPTFEETADQEFDIVHSTRLARERNTGISA